MREIEPRSAALRSRTRMASHIFKGCVICKGKKKRRRNGSGGSTCSASECKNKHKEQRALQSTVGLGAGDTADAEEMADGMWVHEIKEILGERCCQPNKMSHKKRKNGPGNTYLQEFLVRGTFLRDDGDADTDDEEEDDAPEPNTFWVEKADLLETIDRKHVKAALRARHNAVLDGL